MPKTLLTVATRKGTFVLESDDRRDWTLRGPYCEGWPVYHSIYDPNTGSIFAAAASEWHGSAIWRSSDLGETWEHSSEGLSYGDEDGRRISKVSTLARAGDRLLVGVEAPGIFESRDDGKTWSLLSTLSGPARQRGLGRSGEPAARAPRDLRLRHRARRLRQLLRDRAGRRRLRDRGRRLVLDAAEQGPAPRLARRLRGRRLLRPQARPLAADPERMYQQNHVGMHRSDDAGQSWNEITEGLPGDFGFAAAAHPHDRETFYVIPVDGGHGRVMHDGKAAVWRTRDGGSSWQDMRKGLPQENAHLGVLRQGMTIDKHDVPGVYFGTSTGQVFASADEGETWSEIASYLPSISSVDVVVLD